MALFKDRTAPCCRGTYKLFCLLSLGNGNDLVPTAREYERAYDLRLIKQGSKAIGNGRAMELNTHFFTLMSTTVPFPGDDRIL